MIREQIEQAALKCAKDRWGDSESQHAMAKAQGTVYGFKQGAQWRVNSVWHDASEMPEKGRPLLEFCRGTRCGEFYEIGGRGSIKDQEWDDFYKFAGIVYWAYIDELIPEREEEAE